MNIQSLILGLEHISSLKKGIDFTMNVNGYIPLCVSVNEPVTALINSFWYVKDEHSPYYQLLLKLESKKNTNYLQFLDYGWSVVTNYADVENAVVYADTSTSGGVNNGSIHFNDTYLHTQSIASDLWVIEHNMGRTPSITIDTNEYGVVDGLIDHNTVQTANGDGVVTSSTVVFNLAVSGIAQCS